MKLIFCPVCQDIVKLLSYRRTCHCGKSWGGYLPNDDLFAVIGGEAIPLGFDNSSFKLALDWRPDAGPGREFVAFVIPQQCDTVHKQ